MIETLKRIERTTSKVLLAACVALVFIASLARWIGYPIVWSVDIAQLLFIWICFLGSNQAMRRGQHIGVDILTRYLSQSALKWLDTVHQLLILAFLTTIIVYGIDLTLLNVERRFSDTDLSYAWVTLAVPVGSALLWATIVTRLVVRFRGKEGPVA